MRYVRTTILLLLYWCLPFLTHPLRLWYVLALMRCLARPPISIVLVDASSTLCDLTVVGRMCIMHFWLDIGLSFCLYLYTYHKRPALALRPAIKQV